MASPSDGTLLPLRPALREEHPSPKSGPVKGKKLCGGGELRQVVDPAFQFFVRDVTFIDRTQLSQLQNQKKSLLFLLQRTDDHDNTPRASPRNE